MFSSLGNAPFLDYIYTISPDGSDVQPLLTPELGRSYKHASGYSLQSDLAVAVHETTSAGTIESHLYTYRPASGQWQPLVTDASVGEALMSPDNSKIAFVIGSENDLGSFWIMDLKNRERRMVTNEEKNMQTWHAYGAWRPDSQEFLFLRINRIAGGVETRLMSSKLTSDAATVLFGPEVSITAVCYSPDGTRLAALTARGLEIIKLAGLERVVIVPRESFAGSHPYPPGSLIWSRTQDLLAFSLRNQKLGQAELWTVSTDGSNLKKIHTEKDARITATSFVTR
ncbi:MAG TPA: hypothetical protein VJM12_11810 [Pyrinomonadaceae bacterium]|nr:hypothetical protein [Pyrinomonadaceae bacterium]